MNINFLDFFSKKNIENKSHTISAFISKISKKYITSDLTSKASQQIENFFLYMMIKNMKRSFYKNESWINRNKESIYQDIYDYFITQVGYKKGLGLAQIINDQIQKYQNVTPSENLEKNDDNNSNSLNLSSIINFDYVKLIHDSKLFC